MFEDCNCNLRHLMLVNFLSSVSAVVYAFSITVIMCIGCRQNEQRKWALLVNTALAMVLVFVKTLRRWKLLSMANTPAVFVERSALCYFYYVW